jgi:uncharacterized membrane protein YgcG
MFPQDGFGELLRIANGGRPLVYPAGFGAIESDISISSITRSGNYVELAISGAPGTPANVEVYALKNGDIRYYWRSVDPDRLATYSSGVIRVQFSGDDVDQYNVNLIMPDGTTRTATRSYTPASTGGGSTNPPASTQDGTTVPPASQIVVNSGEIWTLGADKSILKNAVVQGNYTAQKLLWLSNALYAQGVTDGKWYRWNGSAFIYHSDTMPTSSQPPTGGGGSTGGGGGSTGGGSTGGGTGATGGGILDTIMNGSLELLGFNIPYWMLGAGAVAAYFMFMDDSPKRRR